MASKQMARQQEREQRRAMAAKAKLEAKRAVSESGEPLDDQLVCAVRQGEAEEVRKLIGLGANPNAKSRHEKRPVLSIAAIADHGGVAGVLLGAGALIEARDGGEATAIYHAAILGHAEMVKLLWDAGVKAHKPGNPGALSIYARQGGHAELAAWLDALWDRRDLDQDTPAAALSRERRARL